MRALIRYLKHYSTIKTLKMVYHAYLHSLMVYGINVWGNSMDSKKSFSLAKEICEDSTGN